MTDPLTDEEIILRHIPGGKRVTGQDFKLRVNKGETGVSVSRFPPTSPSALVARVSQSPAVSRVAAARVADVRALGLEVVPDPIDPTDADPGDPGHAQIVPATANIDKDTRDRLAQLFQLILPGA